VKKGGRGDAVSAQPEIDLVEIEFEDLVLRISALDTECEQRLLDLARDRKLVSQQKVFCHLLGDRRGALRTPAASVVLDIEHYRAGNAIGVETAVLVEVLILGRDKGMDDELWYRLDRQIEAPFAGVFGEERPVGGVHAGHYRRLIILKLRIVG